MAQELQIIAVEDLIAIGCLAPLAVTCEPATEAASRQARAHADEREEMR